MLAPVVQIPVELEKHFVVLKHELPYKPQLLKIAKGIAAEAGEMPEGQALERLLDASAGLTRFEAEGAFSLSLVCQPSGVITSIAFAFCSGLISENWDSRQIPLFLGRQHQSTRDDVICAT